MTGDHMPGELLFNCTVGQTNLSRTNTPSYTTYESQKLSGMENVMMVLSSIIGNEVLVATADGIFWTRLTGTTNLILFDPEEDGKHAHV